MKLSRKSHDYLVYMSVLLPYLNNKVSCIELPYINPREIERIVGAYRPELRDSIIVTEIIAYMENY